MQVWQKRIARVFGNFGVGFFAPLGGVSVANYFPWGHITLEQALIIAACTSAVKVGLSLSYEVRRFGENRGPHKKN